MSNVSKKRAGDRWSSVAVIGGCALALLAGLLALSAAWGYRTGFVELGTAFSLLRWGAYGGAAAATVSLVAVIVTLARRAGIRPLTFAAVGLVLGLVSYRVPAQQLTIAQALPPIHDITTDTVDPPQFDAVLPLRADAPNPPDYDPAVAPQQQEAYPDLTPINIDAPPDQAHERAVAAVETMGWELVDADSGAGRVEATDTTFWFGFKDDVVIRIRPSGSGSLIDVRSKSRVGLGDVGANAARIRAYRQVLTGQ